ncbi:hypothetical protein HAX54_043435 [Datura stramonium]|uniref:Uncharacterized protein n=1 Tax=Datura stramonium TaxID=4076 RepID=A0ABS8W5A5_DATST|nr:hypothetical protein [Datura stramonium]
MTRCSRVFTVRVVTTVKGGGDFINDLFLRNLSWIGESVDAMRILHTESEIVEKVDFHGITRVTAVLKESLNRHDGGVGGVGGGRRAENRPADNRVILSIPTSGILHSNGWRGVVSIPTSGNGKCLSSIHFIQTDDEVYRSSTVRVVTMVKDDGDIINDLFLRNLSWIGESRKRKDESRFLPGTCLLELH